MTQSSPTFPYTAPYDAPKFVRDFVMASEAPATTHRWDLKRVAPLLEVVRRGGLPDVPAPLSAIVTSIDRLREIEATSAGGVERVAEDAVEGALAGTPVSGDFLAIAAAAELEARELQAARMAVAVVRERITLKVFKVVDDSANPLLASVREQVTSALTAGRLGLTTLDGLDPTDAEAMAVASTEQREALSHLKSAREQYDAARALQRIILTSLSPQALERHGLPRTAQDVNVKVLDKGYAEFSSAAHLGTVSGQPGTAARFYEVLKRRDVFLPALHELGWAYANAPATREVRL